MGAFLMSIHTGVYLNWNGETAIVVKVKDLMAYYLSFQTGRIELHKCSTTKFGREFTRHMPSYPVVRAVRKYLSYEFVRSEEADKVMRLILANAKARQ